jgi:pseudouridine-5'-phosphate glycosidase
MNLVARAPAHAVALETTLLLHGVPRGEGAPLARELDEILTHEGSAAAFVGVHAGVATVGLTTTELAALLDADRVPKANTSNLGVFLHRRQHAATTVATTMELAHAAGLRVFATGGLGGVHKGYAHHLDISADLGAFTRFPVAVVSSGVKGLLDVAATRELLESLGVPVVAFRTDRFPAFYLRDGGVGVDATFESEDELASFLDHELDRTGRGVVVANPIPAPDEIPASQWEAWLARAIEQAQANGIEGRDATPFVLGALHRLSDGRTLRANLSLVRSNTALAGRLAARMKPRG